MTTMHNRAYGPEPWRVPAADIRPQVGIPDDAVEQGGFYYWIEGEAPDLRIMCAGGGAGPQQIYNAEYPDEIFDREQRLLRKYRERH